MREPCMGELGRPMDNSASIWARREPAASLTCSMASLSVMRMPSWKDDASPARCQALVDLRSGNHESAPGARPGC